MGDSMEEYKTECYIAKKDSPAVLFEKYFLDKDRCNKWAKEAEERALSEFYNKKVKIIASDI